MSTALNSVRIKKFVATSPYFFLIFLIIPAQLVIGRYLPMPRFLPITTKVLLFNNLCLLVCIAHRFYRQATGLSRVLRYGRDYLEPSSARSVPRPARDLRQALSGQGYHFTEEGGYAERKDVGYLGTLVFYGGMLILLGYGSWANLHQFSGTILLGSGFPVELSAGKTYGKLILGPLASYKGLPQIQVRKQIMPNASYPAGATDMALVDKDKKVLLQGVVEPYKPLHFRDYDINLAKFIFDASITVKTADDKYYVFSDFVKLMPLTQKRGSYTHYAPFDTGDFSGDLYYDPVPRRFLVQMKRKGTPVLDTELVFQKDDVKKQGDYQVTIDKLGQWSELHMSRQRRMQPIVFGAIVAACGLLLRLLVRPRRVWLDEENDGSCRVRSVGAVTL